MGWSSSNNVTVQRFNCPSPLKRGCASFMSETVGELLLYGFSGSIEGGRGSGDS